MSLSRFKENLIMRPLAPSVISSQQRVFGGSDHLALSIFGPEKKEEGDSSTDGKRRMEFLRTYTHKELGKMLKVLRPGRPDKEDWFSLEELSERLVKLREMEEKESDAKLGGVPYQDLRESLQKLTEEEVGSQKNTMHGLNILGQLGRTPGYMLSPPKEELVEKYFRPDNMSASEKLKLELRKVRDEFKMSESDCGSARVQVAQLTTKIKHLSTALQKKLLDKHSRKGLEAKVSRRKKLLKYLTTDLDSYCIVLSKLGLRDNADDNAKKKNYPSITKEHSAKRKAHKN